MQDFEKLGAFYLGRGYDLANRVLRDDLVLYDSKDLTTHGICVGMTGSGKTGLCISLLEEAALDGIPAIIIDPKGDMGNLALSFPGLTADEFRPWVDEAEAARKGTTPDEYAKQVSQVWRRGLGDWGQDAARVARYRDACEVAIYTPGSTAGVPVTVLRSFDPPNPQTAADRDAVNDRVEGAVSGLLALLGIEADPVRSREHILLSNILHAAWREERGLDLAAIIQEIQSPPFEKLGVFELEAFYPAKERLELAMSLNNLLASPGFSAWIEGEPLDIARLLHTREGTPRLSIMSIAHLSDPERMFFVTVLLNELVSWMRAQPGTGSLRAILYMDEIYGYFPPTAMPPCKRPMLTLLKQARAYGLGVLLATQNPVDLDYKGLANTGTWFLGRLQTERDKARVLDGLEGASAAAGAAFDRADMDQALSGLGSRVFLMHNVHDDSPVVMHTRWALSYLRGPLTREQITRLSADRGPAVEAPDATLREPAPTAPPLAAEQPIAGRPQSPDGVAEFFVPLSRSAPQGACIIYRPAVAAITTLHHLRAGAGLDQSRDVAALSAVLADSAFPDWTTAELMPADEFQIQQEPDAEGASYEALPPTGGGSLSGRWERDLRNHLYQTQVVSLQQCLTTKEISGPGESEAEFRARLLHTAREKRDVGVEKLRGKYERQLATIRDRIARAEDRVAREETQYQHQNVQTAISVGATLVGALFGRKLASQANVGRAASAARGVSRASREKGDVAAARRDVQRQEEKLAELEARFREELAGVEALSGPAALDLETIEIRPLKKDMVMKTLGIAWTPWAVLEDGSAEALYG